MKALTIWQPWAELIAIGAKGFETRSWDTAYRGPIAIHASTKSPRQLMRRLPADVQREMFKCIYEHYGITDGAVDRLQTGAIIATAELVNIWAIFNSADHGGISAARMTPKGICLLNEPWIKPSDRERSFGDWTPGRYAWELANVKPLPTPIEVKGKQGLWEWQQGAQQVERRKP